MHTLKMIACGDYVNANCKPDFVDDFFRDLIVHSDIAICNCEAPVLVQGSYPIKKAGPHLFQHFESIKYLKKNGFNYVSLANNHIFDFGDAGLSATINALNVNGIEFVGAGSDFEEAYNVKILIKNGVKIALLAGCENEFGCLYEKQSRGGYAWLLSALIEKQIATFRDKVDFIVMIAHAGAEDIDIPIKEWREIYRRFCDLGVDVLIGHHPHVPQGYEKYDSSLIFYSLGNLFFDSGDFNEKSDDNYSVLLEFYKETRNVDFKIIYHKKLMGKTTVVDKQSVSFNMEHLNYKLESGYLKQNDEVCLELFQKYYYDYYKIALGAVPKNLSFIGKIYFSFRKYINRRRSKAINYLILLHNIRIETHRFIVQRALSLLAEK